MKKIKIKVETLQIGDPAPNFRFDTCDGAYLGFKFILMPQVKDVVASGLAGNPVFVSLEFHPDKLFELMTSGLDVGDALDQTNKFYYKPQTSPGGDMNQALWTPQDMLTTADPYHTSDPLTTWTSAYLGAADRARLADSKGEFTPWYVVFDSTPAW